VRALRIVGASGVGKTALADAIADEAAGEGWLVVKAPSFRIHAGLPLFTARRVTQSLIDALGENAERYRSGLKLDRDAPDEFEESFLRIVEGVTLDHNLLLVYDDAHWADAESRALIERTATALADRPIAVLSTERSEESPESAFTLRDESIALNELSHDGAIEMIRAIYPSVNDEVARAIVADTRGRAADIVAVATFARDIKATTRAEVTISTRRVIARDFSLLDAKLRNFLQICALIEDPIELRVLERIWPKDQLFPLIDQALLLYLVSSGQTLRFVHATILEGILETIPMEIPLRQRIVEALKGIEQPRLEDWEHIARHAAACGDRMTERDALMSLSDKAAEKLLFSLSTEALEKALEIASPARDELVATSARLARMYNMLGRESDALRTCRRALQEADRQDIGGDIGQLVGSLAMAQCHSGATAEAMATIRKHEGLDLSDSDRADLFSTAEYIAMHCLDDTTALDYRERFQSVEEHASPVVSIRHHVANAFLQMRRGDSGAALEYIGNASDVASRSAPFLAAMPVAATLHHAIRCANVEMAERLIADVDYTSKISPVVTLWGHTMIARGAFDEAEEYTADLLLSTRDSLMRRQILSARCSALALRGSDPRHDVWKLAESEVTAFESGEIRFGAFPIVVAWLANQAKLSPARARKLLSQALKTLQKPLDAITFLYPILICRAAESVKDVESLQTLARGDFSHDRHAFDEAHSRLARGVAMNAIGSDGAEFIIAAKERFTALGAPFFVGLASDVGKTTSNSPAGTRPANVTRREYEITQLVAEGLTNREIAERLVLSERTVEGHIASLFNKCNVNSRTQLATWFLRVSSAAS
jgi:DNA-binding CsgD family transcriptional regulator/tetratricopeptide (TPR) repeat protein